MNSDGIIEVTKTLIGNIEPYGSSHVDTLRYDNQEKVIELTEELVYMLIENSKFRNRTQYSMKEIGERAYESLSNLYGMIKNYI